jgi:hypothetical protein
MIVKIMHIAKLILLPAELYSKSFSEYSINPLMPELNPTAQRCLTRVFTGDFAS